MSEYSQMVKNAGIIGIAKGLGIIFSIVNTKVLASVLSASGMGIFSIYSNIQNLLVSISNFGLTQSGVRQIALYNDDDSCQNTAKVYKILKGTFIIISILISSLTMLFSKKIAVSMLGDEKKYIGVCVISIALLFHAINSAQHVLLQGKRRIAALAYSTLLSNILGSMALIGIIMITKSDGIPYLFVIKMAIICFVTSFFCKKLFLPKVKVTANDVKRELKPLLTIGISFYFSAITYHLISLLEQYYLRERLGLKWVGFYFSAWSLANFYIGTILSAMGTDFVPKMMALINKPKEFNLCINYQIELNMFFIPIGLCGIVIFAPLIVSVLYSSNFTNSIPIIRWLVAGTILRLIAFPFGYALTCKGFAIHYLCFQIGFYIIEFCCLVLSIMIGGSSFLGGHYVIAYFAYLAVSGFTCWRKFGFYPSKKMICITIASIACLLISYGILLLQNTALTYYFGTGYMVVLLATGFYFSKRLFAIDIWALMKRLIKVQ